MGLGRRKASWALMLVAGLGAGAAVRGAVPADVDAAADIEAQYEDVLGALKNPPARGVLIAEIEPDSPAIAAGLRGGDIITDYYGERIGTLKELRAQVADATARALVDPNSGANVLVKAFRNGKTVVVQLPRAPLGIRAIEVQAGVPGPRNPPANLRGTIVFDWATVLAAAQQDHDREAAAFRTTMQIPGDAAGSGFDEQWLGWQTMAVEPDAAAALDGKIEIHRPEVDALAGAGAAAVTSLTFHLALGDFKTSAPFLLDDLTAHYTTGDGASVSMAGRRLGAALHATITVAGGNPPRNESTTFQGALPQNAIIQPAIPMVAAALPHDGNTVLAVELLSIRDLLPRPGYVLETLGKKPLPAFPSVTTSPTTRPVETAWEVDLVFCGMLVESYWFSDECRLLAVRTEAAEPVISRRVGSAAMAAAPDTPAKANPQTQPVSHP